MESLEEKMGPLLEKPEAKIEIFLNEPEKLVLESLKEGPISIDELREHVDEVRKIISEGLACMSVVQYAWGVEFDVELTQLGSEYLQEKSVWTCPKRFRSSLEQD